MLKPLIALSLLAAAAPAMSGKREVPAATPAGKTVDCVTTRDIRNTRVRSDQVIDFEMNGGKVYRNTLPHSCPSLGFEERFAYRTSIGQLCSVDIITVLYAGGGVQQGPSCGLGKFQPVTLAKKH